MRRYFSFMFRHVPIVGAAYAPGMAGRRSELERALADAGGASGSARVVGTAAAAA